MNYKNSFILFILIFGGFVLSHQAHASFDQTWTTPPSQSNCQSGTTNPGYMIYSMGLNNNTANPYQLSFYAYHSLSTGCTPTTESWIGGLPASVTGGVIQTKSYLATIAAGASGNANLWYNYGADSCGRTELYISYTNTTTSVTTNVVSAVMDYGVNCPTPPSSCTLTAQAGRTIVNFGRTRTYDSGTYQDMAATSPIAASVATGYYKVTVDEYDDNHTPGIPNPNDGQPHENFVVQLFDSTGSVLATTSLNPDLPDNQISSETVTETNFRVPPGTTAVGGYMPSYPAGVGTASSVVPGCVAFDTANTTVQVPNLSLETASCVGATPRIILDYSANTPPSNNKIEIWRNGALLFADTTPTNAPAHEAYTDSTITSGQTYQYSAWAQSGAQQSAFTPSLYLTAPYCSPHPNASVTIYQVNGAAYAQGPIKDGDTVTFQTTIKNDGAVSNSSTSLTATTSGGIYNPVGIYNSMTCGAPAACVQDSYTSSSVTMHSSTPIAANGQLIVYIKIWIKSPNGQPGKISLFRANGHFVPGNEGFAANYLAQVQSPTNIPTFLEGGF